MLRPLPPTLHSGISPVFAGGVNAFNPGVKLLLKDFILCSESGGVNRVETARECVLLFSFARRWYSNYALWAKVWSTVIENTHVS